MNTGRSSPMVVVTAASLVAAWLVAFTTTTSICHAWTLAPTTSILPRSVSSFAVKVPARQYGETGRSHCEIAPTRLYSSLQDGDDDDVSSSNNNEDVAPVDVQAVDDVVDPDEEEKEPASITTTNDNDNNLEETATIAETAMPSQTRHESLLFLQALGAITGRGEFASTAQKHSALTTVARLEATANNTTTTTTTTTNTSSRQSTMASGTWELVYCSTQLFRSSPFFMAGRAVCTTPAAARQYDWFCDMHRAALAISSIEAVRQIVNVETGRLVSEFEVRAGAIPFLSDLTPFSYSGGVPLAITGALVSSADIAPTLDGGGWEVYMDTVEIKGSNIPGLRQLLDSESVQLNSRSLANVLEQTVSTYTTPKPIFRTTYLDDMYRVSRDQDDNVFFYVKTSSSTEPTDYRKIDADLGLARLLEGFNDAVTRFYI